jgi:hypothetical protein
MRKILRSILHAGVRASQAARSVDGALVYDRCIPFGYRSHHPQRKPLAKSRSEKHRPLSAECARNSLSQGATRAITAANLRKSRHNSAVDTFSSNIRDLLADQRGFELQARKLFRATTLLGIDFHSGVIGALLGVTWSELGALRGQALPGGLPVRG